MFCLQPKVCYTNNMSILSTQISNLPLKGMEGSLLAFAIMEEASDATHFNSTKIREALELAAYLHKDDTRANRANLPRDTYITHPYRNTLRILRYGCKNHDVIIASILHDTVEDHAYEIVNEFTSHSTEGLNEETLMQLSFDYIGEAFGINVARIVDGVSNAPLPSHLSKHDKRVAYAKHVLDVIADPEIFLVKFSDFVDNAVGLYHNTGRPEMVQHLSRKYLQLVEGFAKRLEEDTQNRKIPVSDQGLKEMQEHLTAGTTRLSKLEKQSS